MNAEATVQINLQASDSQNLDGPMQRRDALHEGELLGSLHYYGQDHHAWRAHDYARNGHLANSFSGCEFGLAQLLAVLVLHVDAVHDLGLTHQRNVDAVGGCHRRKRHISLKKEKEILFLFTVQIIVYYKLIKNACTV